MKIALLAVFLSSLPAIAGNATGTVAGQVIDAGSGNGVPAARVNLAPLGRAARSTTTLSDNLGRFAFLSVPPGRYSLTASAPGFVSNTLTQFLPSDRDLDLVDGGQSGKHQLYLWREAVISGTVVDSLGQPAVRVGVVALRGQTDADSARWDVSQRTTTDDRGNYRLPGLPAGEYVMVVPSAKWTNSAATGLPPVFYPAGASTIEAMRLAIEPGETRGGVDFHLSPPVRLRAVAGRVVGLDHGVTCRIRMFPSAARQSASTFDTQRASVSENGSFRFIDVVPGQYVLEAIVMPGVGADDGGGTVRGAAVNLAFSGPLPAPTGPSLWNRTTVDVGDRDITDVTLTLQPGARISGTVIFDGPSPVPEGAPGLLMVVTSILGRDDLGSIPLIPVQPNRRFETVGLPPGLYELAPFTRLLYPWSLQGIRHQNQELTGRPIELTEAGLRSVEVTLTDTPVVLSGTTRSKENIAVPNIAVVAFAKDPRLRHWLAWGTSRVVSGVSDGEGKYRLDGMLPGDYFVVALPLERMLFKPLGEQFDRLTISAISVHLEKRESRVLDLIAPIR